MPSNMACIEQFLLSEASKINVLVIGDVMLDIYYFGDVQRISPEAPVPVVKVARELKTLGGAGNVANNLRQFGCRVSLASATGDDDNCQQLKRLLAIQNIDYTGIINSNRPTITKTRIVAGHQQVVRLDFEEETPLSEYDEAHLLKWILAALTKDVHIVIVSDYGKGVCTPKVCQTIIKECHKLAIPTIIDPKGREWIKYQGADYITPNIKELSNALACRVDNTHEAVHHHAAEARQRFNIKNILVTRSEKGMSLINQSGIIHMPTRAQEVFDVSGAGDTVVATLGVMLAGGNDVTTAVKVANVAAGIVVGKIGTGPVEAAKLLEALRYTDEEPYRNRKILNLSNGSKLVSKWRDNGFQIVFAQGCFISLNPEIICALEQVRKKNTKLLIGIEQPRAREKAKMMTALECVDGVFIIEENMADDVINLLRPDVLVQL